MLTETLPGFGRPRHREKVQGLLGQMVRLAHSHSYCTTLVIEFEKRLSIPALLIAVAANS